MKESTIENYLVRRCKELGVLCYKFVSPSHRGVPDRLLIFPHGLVTFVELKAPGKSPTALQKAVIEQMEGNKAEVAWADSKTAVDGLLLAWGNSDAPSSPIPSILEACGEPRRRMNGYTPEERAALEQRARQLIEKAGRFAPTK